MPETNDRIADISRIRHVGSFRFWFDSEKWEWSDEVAVMHGYEPGEVTPTTELLASHKHPDDRHAFDEMVVEMIRRRTPFSSKHRILDTSGQVHHVAVVSQQMLDESGSPAGAGCPSRPTCSSRPARPSTSTPSAMCSAPTPWPSMPSS